MSRIRADQILNGAGTGAPNFSLGLQVGAATTIHTTGIDLGSGNIQSHNINSTGIITATDIAIDGLGLSYSPSNIEMRGDANVRITLGTAGGTGANNNSNWIYGNGSNVRFNAAGGYYSYEVSGNEKLRMDSSGRLMLGTTTPGPTAGEQLTIADSVNAGITIRSGTTAAGSILFEDDTADRGEIQYSHNGDYMRFKTAGTERLRIDSDGHLQIRLEGVASMSGQDTRHTRYIVKQTNGQEAILGSVFAQGQSGWGGDLVFASKTATADPSTGLTERLRIDSSGLMIFPDVAADKIQLNGNVTNYYRISKLAGGGDLGDGNFKFTAGNTSGGSFTFHSGGSEHVRIDTSGLVYLNTTSNPLVNANGIVNMYVPSGNDGVNIKSVHSGNLINIWKTNTGAVVNFYQGGSQGSGVGNISVNTNSTSYNTSSDYRLKENITAISDGITRLKTLKPSRFNFITDAETTVDGFLAHEVTAVPEAISGTKDEVDADNNPIYQAIDQSKLVPLLTAALQEAITEIETLKTKVAALEGS